MSAELLNIGQMLDELREEFPELTISKIRYLEEQGLLAPQRTAAGYRKFSFSDVERLRFILRQQANFWPLSEIRQTLDDMDRGLVPDMRKGRGVRVPALKLATDGLPMVETFREPRSQLRLSRADLLDASGLDEETLAAVEEFGLIKRRASQTYYDGDDLQVASLVAEFAEQGLEPRHLRHFGTQADRESDLIGQIVGPRTRGQDGDAVAEARAAMAALTVRLHTVLVRNRLRS
ncbi:MAG TPA: MerR family transcriptional regulator [Aeromicrobium sp.]|jgi:DNA-binding transcriptional MerR regulator|nr:MerR family transcriptional regulator [Aeromicrobium sp.]HKY58594.1 MerR family transcriptional regulator [Aeromicrobium sp.]